MKFIYSDRYSTTGYVDNLTESDFEQDIEMFIETEFYNDEEN